MELTISSRAELCLSGAWSLAVLDGRVSVQKDFWAASSLLWSEQVSLSPTWEKKLGIVVQLSFVGCFSASTIQSPWEELFLLLPQTVSPLLTRAQELEEGPPFSLHFHPT